MSQPTCLEQEFAISGFNSNERFERGTVIYGRVCCANTYFRSGLFGTRPVFDSHGFCSRSVATAFLDDGEIACAVHLPFDSALPGYVLRIICLFRSPHTSRPPEAFPPCVSPASRRGVSTGMSMQPGTYL